MAILTCPSPTEIKPLYGTGNYVFNIVKFPDVSFFVQEVELPALDLGVATIHTSVNDFPIPGEDLSFAALNLTFTVDEKMSNYFSVHEWLVGMGFPADHQMYVDFLKNSGHSIANSELAKGFTDATLSILGNNQLPIMQARFVDCFPSHLGGMRFSSANPDAPVITADMTMMYSYYLLGKA